MGRVLFAVIGFLVALIVALALAVYLTRDEDNVAVDNLLAEAVSREIATAEQNDRIVEFAALTDFEWDRLLIVAEDTPTETVEEALGGRFAGQLNYDVESREIFIFLRDGELVRFADYRGRGTFRGIERPIAELTPEEAVFSVRGLVIRQLEPEQR